jgi:MFS family permease
VKGSGISMTTADIGVAAAMYVVGACLGALVFGQLTDRFGRKRLFMVTLGIYITATAATSFAFAPWFFYLFRLLTGAGIGGEYAAINSAIDELIPARARGRVDLGINGSYWLGAAGGSGAALFFLSDVFPTDVGWRLSFWVGVVFGFVILIVRRNVPESPRWMFIHGHHAEAEALVDSIEADVSKETGERLDPVDKTIKVHQRQSVPFREIAGTAFGEYPKRAVLSLALFIGQAFLYNAVTFNLGTVMSTYFAVASATVPIFVVVFALSNLAGPLSLGRLFDTIGRKAMITATYIGSAAITVVLALLLLDRGVLGPWTFIVIVMGAFFLASTGASAAYLTASEIFPMETRALAIAFFYAVGTAAGGIVGPILFSNLIASGHRLDLAIGFFIGAAVMVLGGVAEILFGVRAEQKPLEEIAEPLSEVSESPGRAAGRRSMHHRLGPGSTLGGYPSVGSQTPERRAALFFEREAIARALAENGPMARDQLYELVGARRWGPGAFREALRQAVGDHSVYRLARGLYAARPRDEAG